jgi:hypothetical protein
MNPTHLPLVELEADSGARYYSFCEVETKTPPAFYSPKLRELGTIVREISPLAGGDYRISVGELILDNSDGEFSQLKGQEPLRNRGLNLIYGDATPGLLSNFQRIATLRIGVGRLPGNDFVCPLIDPILDRFQKIKLSRDLKTYNQITFPALPADTPPELVPLILGEVSSAGLGDSGAVKATLIDPAEDQPKYRYAAAQHPGPEPIQGIQRVFHYGQLLFPSAYTIVETTYDGTPMTVLDFDEDMRDPNRPDEPEITFDAAGFTIADILQDNPVHQLLYLLGVPWAVDGSEIDSAAFSLAFVFATPYKTGFALTNPDETRLEVIQKLCQSAPISFFVDRNGLFSVATFNKEWLSGFLEDAQLIDEVLDMIGEDFEVQFNEQVAAQVQYNWGWNYLKGYFHRQPDSPDIGEAANLGEDIRENVNLWYVRDEFTARTVALGFAHIMREDQQYCELRLPPRFYTLDLNDVVRVTHRRGPSADGLGYREIFFRIIGIRISPGTDGMEVWIKAQKLYEIGSADFWRRYMKLGNESALAATWSAASDADKEFAYLGDETDPTGDPKGTLGTADPIKLLM